MTAVGVAMLVFALLMSRIVPTSQSDLEWRDLFSTIPGLIGMCLIVAGLIRWLWLVAP